MLLSMHMELNAPEIIAEVAPLFDAYEKALVANDVDALVGFFWHSAHVARFGVDEQLYGAAEIELFRRQRVVRFMNRRGVRLVLQAFGRDVVCTLYEYEGTLDGIPRRGRQTQTWVRLPEVGWRIVNAHVSLLPLAEAEAVVAVRNAVAVLRLALPETAIHGAAAQFARAGEIAAGLLAFPLPDDAEPAGMFRP